jgi:hypothetical protein
MTCLAVTTTNPRALSHATLVVDTLAQLDPAEFIQPQTAENAK